MLNLLVKRVVMKGMQLVINDLLQSTENPEFIQRVVWVDNEHQHCFLVNVL